MSSVSRSSNVRPVPSGSEPAAGEHVEPEHAFTPLRRQGTPSRTAAARSSNTTMRTGSITPAPVLKLDESPAARRVHGTHIYDTGTPITLTCHLDAPTSATITCRVQNPLGAKDTPKVIGSATDYTAAIIPRVAGDYWYAFAAYAQDGTLLSTRERHFVAQRSRVADA